MSLFNKKIGELYHESGQALIEYTVLFAALAMVLAVALPPLQGALGNKFNEVEETIAGTPTYTVTFIVDDVVVSSESYEKGESVVVPANPEDKIVDDGYKYEYHMFGFANWSSEVEPICTHDAVYEAEWEELVSTWKIEDGTLILYPVNGVKGALPTYQKISPWTFLNYSRVVVEPGVYANFWFNTTFSNSYRLTDIDVENLVITYCDYMGGSFCLCENLTTITGLEKWDVSKLKEISNLFSGSPMLDDETLRSMDEWELSNTCGTTNVFDSKLAGRYPTWYTG